MILSTAITVFMTNITAYLISTGGPSEIWKIEFDTQKYDLFTVKVKPILNDTLDCSENYADPVWQQNVQSKKATTSVEVHDLRRRAEYCIEVTPTSVENGGTCRFGCNTVCTKLPTSHQNTIKQLISTDHKSNVKKRIVTRNSEYNDNQSSESDSKYQEESAETTISPECQNWKPSLKEELDSKKGTITGNFTAKPCFCLRHIRGITFEFFRADNETTVKDCGKRETLKSVEREYKDEEKVKAEAKHCRIISTKEVDPGEYCVFAHFDFQECVNNCTPLATMLHYLYDSEIPPEKPLLEPPPTDMMTSSLSFYFIIPFTVSLLLLLVVLAVKTRKCRHYENIDALTDKDFSVEELLSMAQERASQLELVLFYSNDLKEHLHAVIALHAFLLQSCQFGTVRFDRDEEVVIQPMGVATWTESVTKEYRDRKFIVVESEGALMQEDARKRGKVLHASNDEYLDSVFWYALSHLQIGTRGLDYKSVFVVKFGYSPAEKINTIVPNCRYMLPQNIFSLYCAILDLPVPKKSDVLKKVKEELHKMWYSSLNELVSAINVVTQILEKEPFLIKNSFVEMDSTGQQLVTVC